MFTSRVFHTESEKWLYKEIDTADFNDMFPDNQEDDMNTSRHEWTKRKHATLLRKLGDEPRLAAHVHSFSADDMPLKEETMFWPLFNRAVMNMRNLQEFCLSCFTMSYWGSNGTGLSGALIALDGVPRFQLRRITWNHDIGGLEDEEHWRQLFEQQPMLEEIYLTSGYQMWSRDNILPAHLLPNLRRFQASSEVCHAILPHRSIRELHWLTVKAERAADANDMPHLAEALRKLEMLTLEEHTWSTIDPLPLHAAAPFLTNLRVLTVRALAVRNFTFQATLASWY